MTVAEMHLAIRLILDKTSSFEYASFLQEELDFWLNETQERFIKQRLYGTNPKQEKFDQSQKRMDDLKSLIKQSTSIALTSSSLGVNVAECNLPITDATNPYMFYLNSTLYNAGGTVALQTGDTIPMVVLSRYLKDSINNPYIRRPLVMFYSSTTDKIAFVYGDEFVPTYCDILYIKKPKKLVYSTPGTYETTTCELPEHTHKEIVTMCAELIIENIESPRVQTFSQINASRVE
jgi:hypothetical protein